jgi:hypothetical protein
MDRVLLFPYRDRPVPQYKRHTTTQELLEDRLVTMLAHVAPIVVSSALPDGVRATPLLSTSRDGWIDRGGELENGTATYEPEIDAQGPVHMAVALELLPGSGLVRASKPAARVVVVGDGDVFTNALQAEGPGNSVFSVNLVHWLVGEEKRLGVRTGRSSKVRRLALTKEQTGTLRWISIGLMPFVVLLFGILTWSTRRGR